MKAKTKKNLTGEEIIQNIAKETSEQLNQQKQRLDNVLEGKEEREDRAYTKEEIETTVQKARDFLFPYYEPFKLPKLEPIQSGPIEPQIILPPYETVEELFNGPQLKRSLSMETQPDPDGTAVING